MIPRRVLGLHEQLAHLRLAWPSFRGRVRGGLLTASGDVQPMDLSKSYSIRIEQRGGKEPDVRVTNPLLRRRSDDEPIPHMYSQERLCLYFPAGRDWELSDPIATTIIPWTAMWLFFYEVWLATGDWLGGGIHPEEPENN